MVLNSLIKSEISRLADVYRVEASVLEQFADYVVANYRKKPPKVPISKVKRLTLAQVKTAVLEHFGVPDVKALKSAPAFVMGTNGQNIKLTGKDGWEALYHQFMGGFAKPCTLDNFERFVKQFYPENTQVVLWLQSKRLILGNQKPITARERTVLHLPWPIPKMLPPGI